jgi:hypothetical protein
MLERLLELFFHAKTGALAGVLILGTTGALVTATVSSSAGVTTVTLTEAAPSTSTATLTLTSNSESKNESPTEADSAAVRTSLLSASTRTQEAGTTPTSCDTTQASAAKDAVKTVDGAYSQYHTDLAKLRKDAKDSARTILDSADKLLMEIRQNAVKAIHATVTCDDDKDVEEQEGDNNDTDTDDEQGDNDGNHEHENDKTSSPTTPATTVVTTATGDVKTIAANAVAAMKLAFDTAKAQVPATTATTPKQAKLVTADTKGKSPSRGNGDKGGNNRD